MTLYRVCYETQKGESAFYEIVVGREVLFVRLSCPYCPSTTVGIWATGEALCPSCQLMFRVEIEEEG